jgi:hypothetical protein
MDEIYNVITLINENERKIKVPDINVIKKNAKHSTKKEYKKSNNDNKLKIYIIIKFSSILFFNVWVFIKKKK